MKTPRRHWNRCYLSTCQLNVRIWRLWDAIVASSRSQNVLKDKWVKKSSLDFFVPQHVGFVLYSNIQINWWISLSLSLIIKLIKSLTLWILLQTSMGLQMQIFLKHSHLLGMEKNHQHHFFKPPSKDLFIFFKESWIEAKWILILKKVSKLQWEMKDIFFWSNIQQ